MPFTAGGTGAIEIDRFGKHVAELASGRDRTEEDAASPKSSSDFAEGCFSCAFLTHIWRINVRL